jgi:hypothetical protein
MGHAGAGAALRQPAFDDGLVHAHAADEAPPGRAADLRDVARRERIAGPGDELEVGVRQHVPHRQVTGGHHHVHGGGPLGSWAWGAAPSIARPRSRRAWRSPARVRGSSAIGSWSSLSLFPCYSFRITNVVPMFSSPSWTAQPRRTLHDAQPVRVVDGHPRCLACDSARSEPAQPGPSQAISVTVAFAGFESGLHCMALLTMTRTESADRRHCPPQGAWRLRGPRP